MSGTSKRWPRYEPYLLSGLWHVHTDRTDGSNTVEELVRFAVDRGFPLIGFVEHVRRKLTYDFDALYEEARRVADEYDIRCVVGCEAKVLDVEGGLDVAAETLEGADVVYAGYHGGSFDRDEYVTSVEAMLERPEVDVWAHPFSYAEREGYSLTEEEHDSIARAMRRNDVLLERNLKRPTRMIRRKPYHPLRTVVGYDLHDVDRWGDRSVS